MPAVRLSPLFNTQTLTPSGAPASGYTVTTFAAGSSTPQTSYTDSTGNTPQPNPITLNANGLPAEPIWLQTGVTYKFVLKDASGVVVRTVDNVNGVNDTAASLNQYQASGVIPTYVSATSFTVPGDQTTEFHVGRRVQASVSAGTVYGTITNTVFTSLTTVTLAMDSPQVLDTGLSSVNLSILRADKSSLPDVVNVLPSFVQNVVNSAQRVTGLRGNVNSATPLTKYDLVADIVTLTNAARGAITRYNTGTLTNDLGLTGPVANGRDVSAVFAANSWIYLYFIWNGTTLATISSTAQPNTGPALPSGYTHWALATALRWNASSNIVPMFQKNSKAFYDLADGGVQRILTAGGATTFTAVSAAAFIPPVSQLGIFNFILAAANATAGTNFALKARPTGSTSAAMFLARSTVQVAGTAVEAANWCEFPTNASQQIDYALNVAPSLGGAFIEVAGFVVPNGDA